MFIPVWLIVFISVLIVMRGKAEEPKLTRYDLCPCDGNCYECKFDRGNHE